MKRSALPTSEESWNAGRLALVFREMCKFYMVSATFDNKSSTLDNAKTCLFGFFFTFLTTCILGRLSGLCV